MNAHTPNMKGWTTLIQVLYKAPGDYFVCAQTLTQNHHHLRLWYPFAWLGVTREWCPFCTLALHYNTTEDNNVYQNQI